MKKTSYILLFTMLIMLFTGCKNSDSEVKAENKVSISSISINTEDASKMINEQSNFSASEDFVVEIPKNIDELSDFVLSFSPRQSNEDFYNDFIDTCTYLFPNHTLDNNYLMYYGENSDIEYDDDGNIIQDLNKVKDRYNDIISDNEDVLYFLYDESWNGENGIETPCLAEFTSPICNDLSRFNKGIIASFVDEPVFLESFEPKNYFPCVGTYSPNSTESFKLLDKEMPINEATNFFEDYINILPNAGKLPINMCVVSVDVLQIDDDTYGYSFTTTKNYNNIPFDYIVSGKMYSSFDEYDFVIGQGTMIKSDDVDSAYGIYRSQVISDEKVYDKIISFQSATEIMSNNLTDSVKFDVQKVELIYTAKNPESSDIEPEDYKQEVSPAWKFTLYNPNDKLIYVCYVDAVNGENFRYYTTSSD